MEGIGYWVVLIILYFLMSLMRKRQQQTTRERMEREGKDPDETPTPKWQQSEIMKELFHEMGWEKERTPKPERVGSEPSEEPPRMEEQPPEREAIPSYKEEPVREEIPSPSQPVETGRIEDRGMDWMHRDLASGLGRKEPPPTAPEASPIIQGDLTQAETGIGSIDMPDKMAISDILRRGLKPTSQEQPPGSDLQVRIKSLLSSPASLRDAILLQEILNKPRAMRPQVHSKR